MKPATLGNALIGPALVTIVALMVTVGSALLFIDAARRVEAAEKRKADKMQAVTPGPSKNAVDQGSVTFGETSTLTPAMLRRAALRWPEMTQKEVDALTEALKAREPKAKVLIACKDPMCEDLALSLDNAVESAKWKSEIVIGTQYGVADGIAGSKWLAEAFNRITGGRYPVKVDDQYEGEYLLIGGKPR